MIATSIKQSINLLELGLQPNTSDMYYMSTTEKSEFRLYYGDNIAIEFNLFSFRNGNVIPAWSLSALWDINNICGIGPNNFGNRDVSSKYLLDTLYKWICNELEEDKDGINKILLEELSNGTFNKKSYFSKLETE